MYSEDVTDFSPSVDEIVEKLGEDYAEYINADVKNERKKYADSVEEMLTKLDEFCGLVDMIRSDTNLCLYRTVPDIREKCKEMQHIFAKVDKLEVFVSVVRQSLSAMEESVSQAEDEMGSLSGIKKMLSSISIPSFMSPKKSLAKQKSESKEDKGCRYDPPEIFDTDKYFLPSSHVTAESSMAQGTQNIEPT